MTFGRAYNLHIPFGDKPMTTNRPLRVFLCHSSADKPAARELYQKLRIMSWIQPWLDEEELFPGMDWSREVQNAINSSDVIIVLLSNNSINKEGYVQREIRVALDFADEKPDGTLFIIPVRLEECKPPHRLLKWQYADYFLGKRRERSFEKIRKSLFKRATELDIFYYPVSLPSPKKYNLLFVAFGALAIMSFCVYCIVFVLVWQFGDSFLQSILSN